MAFDAATLIRMGSGIVFVGAGVLVAWASRGAEARRAGWALAMYCVAFGAIFIVGNLFGYDATPARVAFYVQGVLFAVATAALVAFALVRPWIWRLGARMRWAGAGVVILYAVLMATLFHAPYTELTWRTYHFAEGGRDAFQWASWGAGVLLATACALTVLLAHRFRGAQHAAERSAAALLGAAVALYPAYILGGFIAASAHDAFFVLPSAIFGLGLATAVAVWMALVTGTDGRRARGVAWSILVVVALGLVAPLVPAVSVSAVGVVRIAAAGLIVAAVLKHDSLRNPAVRLSVRRGTLAAAALATLFIVAQIAQNFLSAEFGLLTGGIVAGTFLFAANPIQKRIEGIGERHAPSATATQGNEDSFREAVELAFKDRRFEPKEELAFARLATRLGVTAERATEIRHAVEQGVR